jgi:hypothetical protein
MNTLKQACLSLTAAALLAAGGLASQDAQAARVQLGFVLDGSGSITSTEWNTIRLGLASAINLIPVGGDNVYEVSIVQFATNVQTYAQASNVLLDSVAKRTNLSNFMASMPQLTGATNYAAAFTGIGQVLSNTISLADFSFVNFATDGEPNRCGGAGAAVTAPGAAASRDCAVAARNALIDLGVDNISIEGIGVTTANATFLQNSICHPGPCDTTAPFSNFPNEGFYIGVANAEQYAQAIRNKILVVTQQEVPAPGTVALVGLALLALGASTRRRAAAR